MTKERVFVFCTVVLLVCVSLWIPNKGEAQKLPEFRIGMLPDLSGGAPDSGTAQRAGFLLGADEYNKNPKRKFNIKPVVYDDQCKSDKAISLFIRQIEQDKIHAHLSTTCSGSVAAIMEHLQKNKIVIVNPMNSFGDFSLKYKNEPYSYLFRHQASDIVMGQTIGEWTVKAGYKKIGVIYETTGFGTAGADAFEDYLAKTYGTKLVAKIPVKFAQTEVTAEVTKLKDAGADAVCVYAYAVAAAQIYIAMDRMNYRPQIVGPVSLSQPSYVKLAGADRNEGIRVYMNFNRNTEEGKAFVQKLIEFAGTVVADIAPHWSATAYDSTRMLIQAAEAVGIGKQEQMVRYLENFTFDGPTWHGKPFTREDHDSFKPKNSWMAVYRKGVLVTE